MRDNGGAAACGGAAGAAGARDGCAAHRATAQATGLRSGAIVRARGHTGTGPRWLWVHGVWREGRREREREREGMERYVNFDFLLALVQQRASL